MHAAHTCTQRTHARSAHMHAAHTCTQRTHARSAHMHAAHTCTQRTPSVHPFKPHFVRSLAPVRCRLTSRGAKRTLRYEKEKKNLSHEDAPSVHPFKPHFVRSLARSAPLPGCGLPSVEKKKKSSIMAKGATCQPRVNPKGERCDHPAKYTEQ